MTPIWKVVTTEKEKIYLIFVYGTLYDTGWSAFEEIRADEIDKKHGFDNNGLFTNVF